MKRTSLVSVFLAAFLLVGSVFAQSGIDWQQDCPSGHWEVSGVTITCFLPDEEPIPTPTPEPPPVAGNPYPEAPLCADHDPIAYHDLWNEQVGCHYDHTHGDNPHLVDDIFGTELFELMEGEISYPWHTAGENEAIKHRSYMWFVDRDLPCTNEYGPGCLLAYRVFVHADLHNVFAQHHSALVEALVCLKSEDGGSLDPADCGRFLVSGHQATGDLIIDGQVVLDRSEPAGGPRPVMLHYDTVGNQDFATWYPTFYAWMRTATQTEDMWGYYPLPASIPASESDLEFVRLEGNSSKQEPHVISVGVPGAILRSGQFDPDGDGYLDFNGFVNVMTGDITSCSQIGPECAPLILEHVPQGALESVRAGYAGTQWRGSAREYDIFFDGQSSGWLIFPGFVP